VDIATAAGSNADITAVENTRDLTIWGQEDYSFMAVQDAKQSNVLLALCQ
jgi:hypothetical protein